MNKRLFYQLTWLLVTLSLIFSACKKSNPTSQSFSWSPNGDKLALVTFHSNELLVTAIENEKIKNITVIDSCGEKGGLIHPPSWSFDGKYLLYSKSTPRYFEIFVYSPDDSIKKLLGRLNFSEEAERANIVLPQWSPVTNQILWVDWTNRGGAKLLLDQPEGTKAQPLLQVKGTLIVPGWSSNGRLISYSLYAGDEQPQNGLWKIAPDGSQRQHIFKTQQVKNYQWSPDNSKIAVLNEYKKTTSVINNGPVRELTYEVVIIDSLGKKLYRTAKSDSSTPAFYWSPNSRYVCFTEISDEQKNLWRIDTEKGDKLKLSFENVAEHFGWGESDELFFTVKLPEQLVKPISADEDFWDISAFILGNVKKNQLLLYDHFKPIPLGSNIYGWRYFAPKKYAAYFAQASTGFFSEDTYCAAIRFSESNIQYIARTKAEHLLAADENYLQQKYLLALNHLAHISGHDYQQDAIFSQLNVDSIVANKPEADNLDNEIEKGTLLRAIFTLNRLNDSKKADWLFEQYLKICTRYVQNPEHKKDDFDGLFWKVIPVYGKYDELEQGIHDFEQLRLNCPADSLFVGYTYWTQALLAHETGDQRGALQFIEGAIRNLPQSEQEGDDFASFVSLLLFRSTINLREEYSYLIELLLTNPKLTSEKMAEVYEVVGDYYHRTDAFRKAFSAYQIAVTNKFDSHKIWEKIFEIEMQGERKE